MGRTVDTNIRNAIDHPIAIRFLDIILNGEDISAFFRHFGWKKIAVCGMSRFCKVFIKLMKYTDIEIEYIFDKNHKNFPNGEYMGISVMGYSDIDKVGLPDMIVVASNYYYNDIVDKFRKDCIGVVSPVIYNIDDTEKYDYYITGNDQVWNPLFNFINKHYFLDFVPCDAKKFLMPQA